MHLNNIIVGPQFRNPTGPPRSSDLPGFRKICYTRNEMMLQNDECGQIDGQPKTLCSILPVGHFIFIVVRRVCECESVVFHRRNWVSTRIVRKETWPNTRERELMKIKEGFHLAFVLFWNCHKFWTAGARLAFQFRMQSRRPRGDRVQRTIPDSNFLKRCHRGRPLSRPTTYTTHTIHFWMFRMLGGFHHHHHKLSRSRVYKPIATSLRSVRLQNSFLSVGKAVC